ncbi:chorismate synthase [Mesorhizobium sp. NBSH29]|uniref:chorismate synthase n=1 Tax=Mesorhizobium sp. NBSH29 TaxID=2654249 RepID=UPI001896672D|nr:chorismate synthase [Mesorhizobium sp. NBSH29]QPC87003.1 chorismate synthase [Mesorhizobium sp. NBSH29]
MSHNTFGHLFRVTTWGESHGSALGCVVDGCPPGIRFTLADIQSELDKRRPGQSRFVTQRREPDAVRVLSGFVVDGDDMVTTGTPVSMIIENVDHRSKDYGEIVRQFRPGHADYTYFTKYGIRDHRGGGRSSARETAARVAAGALARKVVPGLSVRGALVSMGEKSIDRTNWDWNFIADPENPFFTPDRASVQVFADYLDEIRKSGSSVGAVIEVVADGVPAGIGAPIYAKLDQDIAAGLMSINAVKGVEIGNGFEAARITGEENADEMRMGKDGKPEFLSNNAGGILGGIATGQPVIARFAVKPTSSILTPRKSVDLDGQEVDVMTKGRHDPCVGIRAVPIGEAMVACAIADHYLRHRGQVGDMRIANSE